MQRHVPTSSLLTIQLPILGWTNTTTSSILLMFPEGLHIYHSRTM
jgi:hypothetical protein